MINESKGIGDTVQGLITVIGSALMALAVGGGPLAAVTLGLGTIVTVFQQIQGQADEAKARVQAFLDAIQGAGGAEERANAIREVWAGMFEEMDPEGVQLLVDAGVNIRELTDAALEGGPVVDAALAKIRGNLESMADAGKIPADAVNVIMHTLEGRIKEVDTAVAKFDAINVLEDQILGLDPRIRAVSVGFGTMFGAPPTDAVSPEIEEVNTKLFETVNKADAATEAISIMFGAQVSSNLQQAIDDLITGIPSLISTVAGLDLTTFLGRATRRGAVDDFVGGFLDDMNEAIGEGEITTIPQFKAKRREVLSALREELDLAVGREEITLDEANVLFEEIKTKFRGIDVGDLKQLIQDFIDGQEPEVTISTRGKVRATITGAERPRQIANAVQDFFDARDAEKVTLNVEGKPKLTITEAMTDAEVLAAIRDWVAGRAPGGSAPTGGGVAGHHVMLRSIAKPIEVPVPITPKITVAGGAQTDIGTGIATSIAAGITASAPQISAALNTAIGQALRSGGQLTALFTLTGVQATASFASGITAASGVATAASQQVASAALGGFTGFDASFAGVALGGTFASGISSTGGAASGAASSVASGAIGGFFGFSAYGAGLDLSFGFAAGIRDGASAAVNAAASMASAAVNAARSVLQATSPSKVFRNIGRDIGRGLAEGIRDSEGEVSGAVSNAIDDAIAEARGRVPGQGATRAELAAGIFERTTLPSRLPGGPTNIDVQRTQSAALDAMQELVDLQKEQNRELREFKTGLQEEITETRQALKDELVRIREEAFQDLIDAFERPAAGLDVARQRINLGGLAGQFRTAFEDLIPDVEALGPDATDAERREHERQQRARREALERAGALNIGTVAGRGAANIILDFGQQIRDLGASMLESGAPANQVIRQMKQYRDQLVKAATTSGISGKALQDLLRDLGLTNRQLENFGDTAQNVAQNARQAARTAQREADNEILGLQRRIQGATGGSRALGLGSAAGRENRSIINDALDGIREFGRTALEAGTPVAEVVLRMKQMRNELVQNAVAMGFNKDQINALVTTMGLSNAQLVEFTNNLADANSEFNAPTVPTFPGRVIGPGGQLPAGVRDIHVHLPFGDPEAVALGVSNRLAFELNMPA